MTIGQKLFTVNSGNIPARWKMLMRVALVGAAGALLYYFIEKYLKEKIGA